MANVKEFRLGVDGQCDFELDTGETRSMNLIDVSNMMLNNNSKGLSDVLYDGNNRVIQYKINGVTYSITGWGTSSVVITGNNGSTQTINCDGSGRFLEVL